MKQCAIAIVVSLGAAALSVFAVLGALVGSTPTGQCVGDPPTPEAAAILAEWLEATTVSGTLRHFPLGVQCDYATPAGDTYTAYPTWTLTIIVVLGLMIALVSAIGLVATALRAAWRAGRGQK